MSTKPSHADGLPPWLKAASGLGAWVCIAAVAILSLVPSGTVARTGMGGHLEHAMAYAGAAFLAAAAYGGWARIAGCLFVYAGALEFLQHFSPGRTPSVVDFAFSAIGIVVGVGALRMLDKLLPDAHKLFRPP
jgi:VanZ family protein